MTSSRVQECTPDTLICEIRPVSIQVSIERESDLQGSHRCEKISVASLPISISRRRLCGGPLEEPYSREGEDDRSTDRRCARCARRAACLAHAASIFPPTQWPILLVEETIPPLFPTSPRLRRRVFRAKRHPSLDDRRRRRREFGAFSPVLEPRGSARRGGGTVVSPGVQESAADTWD